MPDKITTLKLVDNTDVFPNIKEENVPNTIMRIADLSKYLNQLKSINITGDIDSTAITSDIATFTTADISTLNVSGVSKFEGEATFGHNVHVDGNLVVYGIDNIFDKDGRKIVNTGSFDPTSDNLAGQKSTAEALASKEEYYATYAIARFANVNFYTDYEINLILPFFTKATNLFFFMFKINILQNIKDTLTLPAFENKITRADCAFSLADDCPYNTIVFNNIEIYAHSIFEGCKALKRILVNENAKAIFFDLADWCFLNCDNLEEVGPFDVSSCKSLHGMFSGCYKLKKLHLKNIGASFDISASTRFEEADLVEIIGNLMDLTGKQSQTLTMGATNLAKLTDSDKAIATNKNWVLA